MKAARYIVQVGANASDEMRTAISRSCYEIPQNFDARCSERQRTRLHLAGLRVLSPGRGIVSLMNLRKGCKQRKQSSRLGSISEDQFS